MPASPRVSALCGPGGRPRGSLPPPEAPGSTEERSRHTCRTSHPVLMVRGGRETGVQVRSAAAADAVTPPDVPGASSLGRGWAGARPHTGAHRHGQAAGPQTAPHPCCLPCASVAAGVAKARFIPHSLGNMAWRLPGSPRLPWRPPAHLAQADPTETPQAPGLPARDPAPPQPGTADLRKTK